MKTIIRSMIDKTALLENFQGSPELTDFRKKLSAWKSGEPTEPLEQDYKTHLKEYAKSGEGNRTMLMRAAANAADPTYLALLEDLCAFPELDVDEEISVLAGTPANAMLMAVKSRSPVAVQLLICAYAKVDLNIPASFMGVSLSETPLSIARQNNDESICQMLEHAREAQLSQLLQALIDCKTETNYAFLMRKHEALEIKKSEILAKFFELCSVSNPQAISLLNQALERDEYGKPSNALAVYFAVSDEIISVGRDEEAVLNIEKRLQALRSGRPEKSSSLLVYKYGPQQLVHPLKETVNSEILQQHHVNSSFF